MAMELKAVRRKRSELWLSIHDLPKISHQARCALEKWSKRCITPYILRRRMHSTARRARPETDDILLTQASVRSSELYWRGRVGRDMKDLRALSSLIWACMPTWLIPSQFLLQETPERRFDIPHSLIPVRCGDWFYHWYEVLKSRSTSTGPYSPSRIVFPFPCCTVWIFLARIASLNLSTVAISEWLKKIR